MAHDVVERLDQLARLGRVGVGELLFEAGEQAAYLVVLAIAEVRDQLFEILRRAHVSQDPVVVDIVGYAVSPRGYRQAGRLRPAPKSPRPAPNACPSRCVIGYIRTRRIADPLWLAHFAGARDGGEQRLTSLRINAAMPWGFGHCVPSSGCRSESLASAETLHDY